MGMMRSVRRLVVGSLLALMLLVSVSSFAGVFVSVGFGPPALPIYVQPPCPAVGYMWTPGYWGYGPNGYFWVPGTWVMAPQPGVLWTPGYWGWGSGAYFWHGGYWGPTIGFYGGINYGYGYGGFGYQGGYWRNGAYYYNRSVNNVSSIHVTNVYNTTVINNTNHTAFNGGEGGIQAHATPAEAAAAREHHIAPTAMQTRHETAAASNRELLASVNHGRQAIAATARPGEFSGHGVVAAKAAGAPFKAPASGGAAKPAANNAVPRPGNNSGRPAIAEHAATPATHNTVPRPATAPRENVAQPSHVPHPAVAPQAAPPHVNAAPRAQSAPHPVGHPAPPPREEGHPKGRG